MITKKHILQRILMASITTTMMTLVTACGGNAVNTSMGTEIGYVEETETSYNPELFVESVNEYQYFNKNYSDHSAFLLRMNLEDKDSGDSFWVCKCEKNDTDVFENIIDFKKSKNFEKFSVDDYHPSLCTWTINHFMEENKLIAKTVSNVYEEYIRGVEDYGNGWVLCEDIRDNRKLLYYGGKIEDGLFVADSAFAIELLCNYDKGLTKEQIDEIMSRISFYEISSEDMLHGKDNYTGEIIDLSAYCYVDDMIGEHLNKLGICIPYEYIYEYDYGLTGSVKLQYTMKSENSFLTINEYELLYLDVPVNTYDLDDISEYESYERIGSFDIKIGMDKEIGLLKAVLLLNDHVIFRIQSFQSEELPEEFYDAIEKYFFGIGVDKEEELTQETQEDESFEEDVYPNISVPSCYTPINSTQTDKHTFVFRAWSADDYNYVASLTFPDISVDEIKISNDGELETEDRSIWFKNYKTWNTGLEFYYKRDDGEEFSFDIDRTFYNENKIEILQDYGNGWLLENPKAGIANLYYNVDYSVAGFNYTVGFRIYFDNEHVGDSEYIKQFAQQVIDGFHLYRVSKDDMLTGTDLLSGETVDLSAYVFLDDIIINNIVEYGITIPDYTYFTEWDQHDGTSLNINERKYDVQIDTFTLTDKSLEHLNLYSDNFKGYQVYYDNYEFINYFTHENEEIFEVLNHQANLNKELSDDEKKEMLDNMINDLFYNY